MGKFGWTPYNGSLKMETTKRTLYAYKELYSFLKECGILVTFLNNLLKKGYKKRTTKEMLINVVKQYEAYHVGYDDCYCNLFNFGPATFYWSDSIEGEIFWIKYYDKWCVFCKNAREKHSEEYENMRIF